MRSQTESGNENIVIMVCFHEKQILNSRKVRDRHVQNDYALFEFCEYVKHIIR